MVLLRPYELLLLLVGHGWPCRVALLRAELWSRSPLYTLGPEAGSLIFDQSSCPPSSLGCQGSGDRVGWEWARWGQLAVLTPAQHWSPPSFSSQGALPPDHIGRGVDGDRGLSHLTLLLCLPRGVCLSFLVAVPLILLVFSTFLVGGNVQTLLCQSWESGELYKVSLPPPGPRGLEGVVSRARDL